MTAHLFLHLCPEHLRRIQCLAYARVYGVLKDSLDILRGWMYLDLQVSQFIYLVLTLGLTFSLSSTIELGPPSPVDTLHIFQAHSPEGVSTFPLVFISSR